MKNNTYYRLAVIILLSVYSLILNSQQKNQMIMINWDKLHNKWETYINNPSEQNALNVCYELPAKGHIEKSNSNQKVVNEIYQNLSILENSINNTNQTSLELAFHLFTISDGAFTETLEIIIGNVIKKNPELFLFELEKNPNLIKTTHILTNIDYMLYDSKEKQILEVDKRITALNSILNSKLFTLRDLCIKELESFKKSLNGKQNCD